MEICEKERDLKISYIDQDRLDIHDFLKKLKKCDSDNLPEAKHWLGDRTPRRQSQMVVDGKRKSVPVPNIAVEEDEEEKKKKEREREEYEKYNFTFRAQEDKPEMVQRATRLYNLYSKRAIYAGMNQQAWDDWNEKQAEHDRELENKAVERPNWPSSDTASRNEENDSGLARAGSPPRCPPRATFTADATVPWHRSHTMPVTGPQHSHSAHPTLERSATDGGDFMKEILYRKCRRRKKKKAPLEERLQSFYDKVGDLKSEEMAATADLADWENARRWKVLTKGVKAALADSSDEEEPNPEHTL